MAPPAATSPAIAPSSGAVPIAPRACSSNGRRPNRSRTCGGCADRRRRTPPGYTARVDLTGCRGAADLLSRPVRRSRRLAKSQRSRPLAASVGAAAGARRDVRLVRRHGRSGLGHQRGSGAACASTRRCAARSPTSSFIPATRFTPTRRCRRKSAARRHALEEPHHAGQVEGRRNARGVPRQLHLQPARRARAPLQRRGSAAVLWDDHEVKNNWYPGMSLTADERYTEKDPRVLAANARRAFLEYSPIRLAPGAVPPIYRSCSYGPLLEVFAIDLRTYRGPNSSNRQTAPAADTAHAGAQQLAWLKRALRASDATWKVIASDLPIGLVVRDGARRTRRLPTAMRPAARPRARDRRAPALHAAGADSQRRLGHRRRALRRGASLRSAARAVQGSSIRSGSSSPARCTRSPARRSSSTAPSGRRSDSTRRRAASRPPSARPRACSSSGRCASRQGHGVMTVSLHNLAGDSIYAIDLEPER